MILGINLRKLNLLNHNLLFNEKNSLELNQISVLLKQVQISQEDLLWY
jgi:hypothetical protein